MKLGCEDLGQGPLAGSLLCGVLPVFGLYSCEQWDDRDQLIRILMEVVTIQSHICITGLKWDHYCGPSSAVG
jgi:hypothetical protein